MKIWAFLKPGSTWVENCGNFRETLETVKAFIGPAGTRLKRAVHQKCPEILPGTALAGALLIALGVFGGGCAKSALPGSEQGLAAAPEPGGSANIEQALVDDGDAPEEPLISEGAVHDMPAHEIVVPANLRPSEPVAQIIKLVNAGNDEALLLAFVTNSTGAFNLSADQLIYLSDIGTPPRVLTAILQHDHMRPVEAVTVLSDDAGETPGLPGSVREASPYSQASEQETGSQALAPQESTASSGLLPAVAQPVASVAPPPPLYPAPDAAPNGEIVDDSAESAAPQFYDALAPYGSWLNVEGYGQCWQPTVALVNQQWCPYADRGHWVYNDCGWYWASDYSWGWAPFHYGRWFQHARLGWCWVPGRVWSSAWVCWRTHENFCGWAPLPPGARFSDGARFHGLPVKPGFHFQLAANQFHFVSAEHLTDRHPLLHAIPRERVHSFFHDSVATTSFVRNGQQLANTGLRAPRNVAAAHRPLAPSHQQMTSAPSRSPARIGLEPALSPRTRTAINERGSTLAGLGTKGLTTATVLPASRPSAPSPGANAPRQIPSLAIHHEPIHASIPLSTAVSQAHQRTALSPYPERHERTALSSTTTVLTPGHSLVMTGQHRTSGGSANSTGNNQVLVNQPVQIPWWRATPPNVALQPQAQVPMPQRLPAIAQPSANRAQPEHLARGGNRWQPGNPGWSGSSHARARALSGEPSGRHSWMHAASGGQPEPGVAHERHHVTQEQQAGTAHHESRSATAVSSSAQQAHSPSSSTHSFSSSAQSRSGRR